VPKVKAVVPLLVCRARTPDASPVEIKPVVELLDAFIVDAIIIPNI